MNITEENKIKELIGEDNQLERYEFIDYNDVITGRNAKAVFIRYKKREIKSKWLADEFQVLDITDKWNELCKPTSPKGKIFDDKSQALLHHAKLKYIDGIKFKDCICGEIRTVYGVGVNQTTLNDLKEDTIVCQIECNYGVCVGHVYYKFLVIL